MDLHYTPEEQAFRAEVRQWMAANVPTTPLPDFDSTRAGFEAHREWERTLHKGGWGMVTWPAEYGGRGLDLIRWLIFEEEYYRARGAGTRQPERHLPARSDADRIWHARAKGALPSRHGRGRRDLGAGLVRARRGQRPCGRPGHRDA